MISKICILIPETAISSRMRNLLFSIKKKRKRRE
jgi:hypothetical protein